MIGCRVTNACVRETRVVGSKENRPHGMLTVVGPVSVFAKSFRGSNNSLALILATVCWWNPGTVALQLK
ncbi:MAG: hypothetical protein ACI8P0_004514 [Planctomycetaceae bacterium]|jgi:hypothetical protein